MNIKKLLYGLLVALLFACTARAQVTYHISGTAPADVRYILLSDVVTHQVLDSCFTSKGAFQFEGTLPENTFVNLSDSWHELDATLIINDTPIIVDMENNFVRGSELNVKFNEYYRQILRLQVNVISDYRHREELLSDTTRVADRQKIERSIQLQLENITAVEKGIVDANIGNIISAYFLRDLSADLTLNELRGYLNEYYPFREHPILYPTQQRLRELEKNED